MEVTNDTLMDGKIFLCQPKVGYRVAIDPIFLAAAVPARENEAVLDIGTGVGAAMLCLAHRVPKCRVVGLDLQRELVKLASENIRRNGFQERLQTIAADLLRPPPRLTPSSFHHVMSNPPYLEAKTHTRSLNVVKALSHQESTADLEKWVYFCYWMLQPKGTVTFVYRADRLEDLLFYFRGKFGEIIIYPLWPGPHKEAKRVLVQARKNIEGPLHLMPGLILHDRTGKYTDEAIRVLRMGMGLDLMKRAS